jgi:hypothetical protein
MGRVSILAVCALVVGGVPASAEKIPDSFKRAFETTCRRGSFAVVVQKGVPTTSIYGVDGKQTDAHYSIDILDDANWKTSEGLLDFNQTAVDFLQKGEVMEVATLTYKDNRVDMRMVSLESKKVSRGTGFGKSDKREPVATNFKFFFPFEKTRVLTPEDMPAVKKLIGAWLAFFPTEDEARSYAARVVSGQAPTARESRPDRSTSPTTRSDSAKPTKKEIKVGMTALEVMDVLGRPQKEVSFENTSRWTYPDLTVIFANGRVKEVRF